MINTEQPIENVLNQEVIRKNYLAEAFFVITTATPSEATTIAARAAADVASPVGTVDVSVEDCEATTTEL